MGTASTVGLGGRLLTLAEAVARPLGLGWLVAFAATPGRVVEFARYTLAAGASLAFDTTVFLLAIATLSLSPPLAGAIGYLAGMLVNYLLSVRFIFAAEHTGKSSRRLVGEYVLSGLLGVALTTALIAIGTSLLGLSPILAKAASVGFTFLAIYLVRAAGVFAPRAPQAE